MILIKIMLIILDIIMEKKEIRKIIHLLHVDQLLKKFLVMESTMGAHLDTLKMKIYPRF